MAPSVVVGYAVSFVMILVMMGCRINGKCRVVHCENEGIMLSGIPADYIATGGDKKSELVARVLSGRESGLSEVLPWPVGGAAKICSPWPPSGCPTAFLTDSMEHSSPPQIFAANFILIFFISSAF